VATGVACQKDILSEQSHREMGTFENLNANKIFTQMARIFIQLSRKTSRGANIVKALPLAVSLKNCGKNFRIVASKTTIINPENISIGSNFSSMGELYLYGDDGIITIGDNCSFNTNVIIGASGSKISIGDNVLIAPNVVIRAADHVYANPCRPIRTQGHIGAEIIIEDDVWICSNCVITKGCIIGKGSVIAAGSVVSKSVKPYTVAGGVPARAIKRRG